MSEETVVLEPNPDNDWVCHLCYQGFEHVAWLTDNLPFCLIKHEGKFHFVGSSDQGHNGCIWLTFEQDPFAEPGEDEDCDEWNDHVMDPFVKLNLNILEGYECHSACLAAGYDRENDEHGHVYYWLAKWTGQAVADFKAKVSA